MIWHLYGIISQLRMIFCCERVLPLVHAGFSRNSCCKLILSRELALSRIIEIVARKYVIIVYSVV